MGIKNEMYGHSSKCIIIKHLSEAKRPKILVNELIFIEDIIGAVRVPQSGTLSPPHHDVTIGVHEKGRA
jgi:hypothetical protein